jgi:hypothetical protein
MKKYIEKISIDEHGILGLLLKDVKDKLDFYHDKISTYNFSYYINEDIKELTFDNKSILEYINDALKLPIIEELNIIEKFEKKAFINPLEPNSQAELLSKLLINKDKIKDEEFSYEHIFSWIEDREYTRTGSFLTLKTPVLTTLLTVVNIIEDIATHSYKITSLKNELDFVEEELNKEKLKYESCLDLEFKEKLLSEKSKKVKDIKSEIKILFNLFKSSDICFLFNNSEKINQDSFFVKENLSHIIENIDIKGLFKYFTELNDSEIEFFITNL